MLRDSIAQRSREIRFEVPTLFVNDTQLQIGSTSLLRRHFARAASVALRFPLCTFVAD
jgi:hypothetical protein